STFIHEKSEKKSLVWQSTRDKGESGTKVVMTELEAGGALSVSAAQGVVADYRASGDLQSSLAALAQDPRTAWVGQIAQRDDVNWRAVNESYQSWDHKTQGLTPAAAMIIAIAVTIATQGYGAGLLGAATSTSVAAGTMTATAAAMANAGFAALVSQASVSLINNQGNLSAVLRELGTIDTVKNLAVAVATAGLTQGIADAAGVSGSPASAFAERAAYQGIKAGVGVAVNSTIGGADFGDALVGGGLSMATAVASQTLFKGIGDMAADLKIEEGDIRKVIAHALAGCAAGQITRNCVGGAIGAGLQELGADKLLSDKIETQVQLAGLIAATATLLVGGDADAVSTANSIAQDARTYNRQLHVKELQAIRDKAKALADANGDGVLSAGEAAQASDWETRLTREALRTVDSYWDKKLAPDGEAAQILRDLATSSPNFDVTEGGKAVAFLQRDSFYNDHALYSRYIKSGADLYDKALQDWATMGAGADLGKSVRPSTLAVLYATADRNGKFYYSDPSLPDAENARREQLVLAETLSDLAGAKQSLETTRQQIQTALGDKTLSPEQKKALVELDVKTERQRDKVIAAEAHLLESVLPYRADGVGTGLKNFTVESIQEVVSLASDLVHSGTPEGRQALLARVDGMVAAAKNPGMIAEYYEQQFSRADDLEKAGSFDEAAAIRTQATAEVLSLLSGTAALVKGGATLSFKIAGKAGELFDAGKVTGGTGHGIASAAADAEVGLTGNGSLRSLAGVEKRVEVAQRNAADVNGALANKGYEYPPHDTKFPVVEFKTGETEQFVRFVSENHTADTGSWVVKASDVQGLTPSQIKDRLALEFTPTHVLDVSIPANTTLQRGVAAKVVDRSGSVWGNGGATQYQIVEDFGPAAFNSMFSGRRVLQ
ncbi:MAG: DUF637 domain-containing protein, partial [Rhodospirillaceae bacterium]|nr:DUF637 domain-containing protein [Rhodospirillales bacterium]